MDKLVIIQHNINNWRSNKQSLLNHYLQVKPDIILINSHGLTDTEQLKIPSYKVYKINSTGTNNDGSAIAVKPDISHKLFDDFMTDFLAIEINTAHGPIIISTTYLPPRRPYLPFPDMHRLLSNNIPTYIIGDFNATHRSFGNASNNTVGISIVNLINQGQLLHIGPHFPTFIHPNFTSAPDKIFCNKYHYLNTYIEPGNVTASDHLPIILTLSTTPIFIKREEKYAITRADWTAFQAALDANINTDIPDNINNAASEREIEKWTDAVTKAMKIAIPRNTHKRIIQFNTTQEIRQLEAEFKTLHTHATVHGWTIQNYQRYRRIRVELKDKCKMASSKNWEDKLEQIVNSSKDIKTFWGKVNQLRGKPVIHANYLKDQHNNRYYSDTEKCTIMERTWKEIFKITDEEEQKFDAQHSEHITGYMNTHLDRITPHNITDTTRLDNTNYYTREITIAAVNRFIKKTKKKAPGESGITKEILEHCTPKAIAQLTHIYNLCLSAGYFPSLFKKAIIKFIPKANKSPHEPLNYRPISLLEVHGKIFEKIIQTRLTSHLQEHQVIHNRQHGFRPARGTTTAIATAYEYIATSLANKNQCFAVLRDVAKAFDKVWHSGLKYKIIRLGLPELLEKILCNFLDSRTSKIKIGTKYSNSIRLESGVPQGSVISPSLYTLYTNDTPPAGPGCLDIMYADDVTQIITSQSKSKNMMKLKVQREINRINRFEKIWKIQTSENKFKIIPLAQKKTEDIEINGRVINKSKEGTMLGLKLNTTGIIPHITERIRKTNAVLTNLYRFRSLTPHIKTTLVKTLVLPVLEYPPIPLICASKTQKLKMQLVINRAHRFIFSSDNRQLRLEDMHHITGITPINISLYLKATKIWENVRHTDEDTYLHLTEDTTHTHGWFPRSHNAVLAAPPDPVYTI